VLIRQSSNVFEQIRDSSAQAGLVFMGMRQPEADESVEDYSRYYGTLIESTRNMPPVAFVLAAEAIEFRKVIGISQMS